MPESALAGASPPEIPPAVLLTLYKGIVALEWNEFEKLTAAIFEGLGYDVSFTPGTDDQGIDLMLRDAESGALDVAQCKHWKDQVGSPVVRDFFGAMIHFKARKGYLISTAGLTDSAKAFATGKPISVWGPDELVNGLFGKFTFEQQRRTQSKSRHTFTLVANTLDQLSGRIRQIGSESLFGKGLTELNYTLRELDDFSKRIRDWC
jgi:hypothetical protein